MGILAIHGQNYKSTQLSALDRHNMRRNEYYSNRNIDRNLSRNNIVLIEADGGLYQATLRRLNLEVIPYQNRKLRKDANWIAEFCVTMPDDVTEKTNIMRFCDIIINYFSGKIGCDNILSAVVHLDETTPHLHLDFVPITADHRLSAKKIMTRNFLTNIHDDLPRILQNAGFAVERGVPVPETQRKEKSKSIQQYKREEEAEKQALDKEIHALQQIRGILLKNNYKLAQAIIAHLHLHDFPER